ncbi:relaxase family protein [Comamonas suwonensis]|uniref:Relaxase/mobilization nuclease domain-containing protein n=1 Tax=Comamonas suwonensis TaxID=2606214 RepID=A0A843B563_9BURK|nr:relaxase/mobilization nuclease domain-containing protein [Comamonas suwonensis]MBI1625921.1 relaxase/mobilization nuclease domain-containing protein [Comamonas suwonensis]
MPHGKGDAMQAAQYLLSQHDHAGKPRSVAPDVLDGDPVMVATIANQTHRAHKYACGCLSFRDGEQPTAAQQKEIMRDFERTFLPGLQKGRHYAIAWVAHEDKGNLELNYLLATTELTTGKQLNPFPPGDVQHEFNDAWVANTNHVLGYAQVVADPLKIARSRFETKVLPLKDAASAICQQASSHKQVRNELQALFGAAIVGGDLNSRADVVDMLQNLGTVTRTGKDYLSFVPHGEQKAIRLKGPMFHEDADYQQIRADAGGKAAAQELTEDQFSRNGAKLERLKQSRAEHFQKLYAQPLGKAQQRTYGPKKAQQHKQVKPLASPEKTKVADEAPQPSQPVMKPQEEPVMQNKNEAQPKKPRAALYNPQTKAGRAHSSALLNLGRSAMPLQVPALGALVIQVAMLNAQLTELTTAYERIPYGDPHYGKKRMELYDRMRLVQLALEALTLQLNEAKFKLGDEDEKKNKPKVW